MEIERKYLIPKLPADYETYPHREIEQGYLSTAPVVRIRRSDQDYILTYKGGGMMVREEFNLPLNQAAYEHLRPKADGILIHKKLHPELDNVVMSAMRRMPRWQPGKKGSHIAIVRVSIPLHFEIN